MKSILVPTDFSSRSRSALEFAGTIAKRVNARLTLLNVLPIASYLSDAQSTYAHQIDDIVLGLRVESKRKMEEWVKEVDFLVDLVIVEGNITDTLIQFACEKDIDLIVMGTNGSEGVEEVIIGSNAEKVVRLAPCPVVTINRLVANVEIPHVLFVHEFDRINIPSFQKILDLFSAFESELHLVRINTPSSFQNTKETMSKMKDFVHRWDIKKYTIEQYDHHDFEEGISEYAQLKEASLVVIGTHGRQGLSYMLKGSMTESLVNHIDLPVLSFKLN